MKFLYLDKRDKTSISQCLIQHDLSPSYIDNHTKHKALITTLVTSRPGHKRVRTTKLLQLAIPVYILLIGCV